MGRKSGDRSSSYIFVPETDTSQNSTSPRQTSSENSTLRRMSCDNSSPRQASFNNALPRRTSFDNSSPRRSSVIRKSPQRKVSIPKQQVDETPSTPRSADEKSTTFRQSEGRSSPSKEEPSKNSAKKFRASEGRSSPTKEDPAKNSAKFRQSEGRSSPSKEDPSNPPPSTSGTPRSKGQPRRAKRNAGQGTMQNRSSADDKQTIELLKTTVADLRSQLVAAREARDDEKIKIKTIRREAQVDLRRAREEEQERAECMFQELRNRSEHEKNLACAAKEEYLEKQFQAEFTRFANRKEEELKKIKADEKRVRDEIIIQVRESQRSGVTCQCSPHLSPTGSLDRPRPPGISSIAQAEKMTQELIQLREQKRKLEEILQIATETERRKAHEIRCIHEEHEEEIKQLRKMAKNDAYKLMEELRSKDKQIGELDRQVQKLASKDMSASTAELEERASGREKRLNLKLAELQEKVRLEGQEANKRERELQDKIKKLQEFNEQLKATMIRRLSEADKSLAPLKSKNRQFVSRNLELTSRNRELQQTLRQLTIEYNQQKEQKEKEQLKESLKNSKNLKSASKTDDIDGSHKRKLEFSRRRQNSDKVSPIPGRSRSRPGQNQDKPHGNGRTKTLVKKKEKRGCGDGVGLPECCPDYHRLYTHLQKEFTELQRSYQLLQTHAALDSIADPQREEKSKVSLKNDLKVALSKIEDLEKVVDGSAVETKLVEEKKEIYALNLGLSEKIRYLHDRENRLMAELQDSKDQSELLEFRVLELEECQEKQSQHNLELVTPTKETRESWTETESTDIDFFNDSGCPSVTTDEDIQEIQQDFRNEKIADTKNRLHALIGHVQGTTSKSLLLQSVALFETLLNKIHELQNENETLKAALMKIPSGENVTNGNQNDELIIENEELKRSKETLTQEIKNYQNELEQYKQKYTELTEELNKNQNRMHEKEEVHRKLSDMQSKVEVDLKKQVNILNNKLDSTLIGCQSESEMLEESMLKVSGLERFVEELKSRLESFRSENNELKDQLSSALEHHTTKSSGSLGSDFDSNKVPSMLSDVSEESNRKTTGSSSGIASDLSDSEMEPLDMRSRSVSPEKSRSRFLESGMFDSGHYVNMETQTNEQYIKEITSLTEEIEKLTAFRDMIENKMILPISGQPIDQYNYNIHEAEEECMAKESTPIIETGNLENNLQHKIDALEKSSNLLTNKYQQLLEEKCELEEAENDSRLKAQVFEQQLISAENKARDLNDALVVEKKAVKHLRNDLERLRDKEYDTGNEIGYLEVLTQQYEQRICELEEKEHHLKEGLQLLLKAVTIYSYVNMIRFSNTVQRRALGNIKLLVNIDTQTTDLKAIVYTGSQRRPASTELDEEPETKKAKIYDTSRNISDLENCIETLQRGKKELEYALITVTAEKEAMAESLEGSHEDKIERIITLEDKIAELLHTGKTSRDQYHRERAYMKNQYESRIVDLTDKERKGLQRIAELEDSLTNVRNELEIVTINLNAAGNSSIEANEAMMNAEKCKDAELKLEEIIADHQKKESAYRKTIEEADGIMSRLEYSYQGKIKDLEDEKQQILDRITYYKENELRLKQTIKSNGKDDMQRVGELLEQLMEVEKSELTLKEKVYHMEKSASELNMKLLQEQKCNSDLRNDIRDQEELLTCIGLAESENQSLLCEINHLKEFQYKNQELQQSEEFLQGRVNELEQMENFLTEALSQSEQNYNLREKKLQDRISCLEMEIQDSHSSASSYEFAFDKLRGEDNTLKTELDNLKAKVAELTSELQHKSTDSHENETSMRNELNKSRQQLALANNQLEEIDAMNSQLREDLEIVQQINRDKELAIENMKNKCEQSTIKWNLQLEEKESHMRDLKERLDSREVSVTSEEELDDLARQEGGLVHVTKEVEMAAVTVQACPSCSDDVSARLHSAAAQLATLSTVICGQNESLDSCTDIQALRRCESEEILSMPGYSQMDDEVSQALESQLEELQVKFGRMEEEMTIVSEESKELQERLEAREEEIKEKSNQLVELTVFVENLRQLNETSAETIELEKKKSLCLKEEAELLTVKCGSKNRLIKVLADTLAVGSNLPAPAIISAIKTHGEGAVEEDFTPETVCQLVNRKISHKKLVSDEEMKKIEELKSLASKEFRDRSPLKEHDFNLTLLPPENFRITRRVGSDGLLVAWTTPEDDEVTGYMIYIDDVPHQRVRSASRTKALLHGLAMDQELTIRIHSTNQMDQLSQTLTLVYDPSLVLPEDKKKNKDNTVDQ